MAVTINDVAKRAGVSPSTVSRVISGNAKISDETSDKINKIMKDLGYHPNSQARNLAKGVSNMIGLVINTDFKGSFSNVFFNSSVFGIEKIVQDVGYNLIITNNIENEKNLSSVENLLFEKKVDGVILPPSILSTKLIREIKKNNIPFVVLGDPATNKDDVSWVDINNRIGSKIAVNHLFDQGYKKIAYIGGNKNEIFSNYRIRGYEEAIKTNSIIRYCESDKNTAKELVIDLLEYNEIDALICNDNIVAYGAILAAKSIGKKIPEDIGIVTFDNFPLAEYTEPELTSIVIDTYKQGEQAAKLLFDNIKGKNLIQNILISPTLEIRKSSRRTI